MEVVEFPAPLGAPKNKTFVLQFSELQFGYCYAA